MQVNRLSNWLEGFHNKDFIVQGFRQGFLLQFEGHESELLSQNAGSARLHANVVDLKLLDELNKGRIAGPFNEPPFNHFKTSPMAVREKQEPGKFRLLHNLSYPYDSRAVNANISKVNSAVTYSTIQDAIKLIQDNSPNAYLAKSDIAEAFRIIPLHPSQYHLTGFFWNGFYYDKCLPMGCSSSCQIFSLFSDALLWILKNKLNTKHVIKVLDDFLFVEKSHDKCMRSLASFLFLCNDIGVPVAPHKTLGPVHTLVFLGIELDSTNMCARLPHDKLVTYYCDILQVLNKQKITLRQLKSLIGKLQFATVVVRGGRPFLRRLHDLTCQASKPFHFIRLNNIVKNDLQMWLDFLKHYNGKTFIYFHPTVSSTDIHFCSDASKKAFGGTYGKRWIQCTWPHHWKEKDITFLEFYPIYVLVSMFACKLVNAKIIFHCDNEAVVAIINKQTSKNAQLMSIMRPLVLLLLKHNIILNARHLPGIQNNLCDAISRLQVNLPALLTRYGMQTQATPIPLHLRPDNFKQE